MDQQNNMELNAEINEISQTAFLTLQCHAMDARSTHPVLNDRSSVQTLEKLKAVISPVNNALYRRIAGDRVRKSLVTYTVLRAKQYDDYIRRFLERYPDAAVINIGCGLDDRFARIDNGKAVFYDLDLPDIMNIKQQIFPPGERYHQLSRSVFDFAWMEGIRTSHMVLAAEGVFMYCEEKDVKALFRQLQSRFRDPEIIFEVFSRKWLGGWRRKIMETKMKKGMRLGEDTFFKFGIDDSDEIESWHPGYRLLEDWSYFESPEASSMMRLFGRMGKMRKVQWTVRYGLES